MSAEAFNSHALSQAEILNMASVIVQDMADKDPVHAVVLQALVVIHNRVYMNLAVRTTLDIVIDSIMNDNQADDSEWENLAKAMLGR